MLEKLIGKRIIDVGISGDFTTLKFVVSNDGEQEELYFTCVSETGQPIGIVKVFKLENMKGAPVWQVEVGDDLFLGDGVMISTIYAGGIEPGAIVTEMDSTMPVDFWFEELTPKALELLKSEGEIDFFKLSGDFSAKQFSFENATLI